MDAKIFIGIILLLVGVYTIALAFEIYEIMFIPSEWVLALSGLIVAIYSLKFFKSSSQIPAPASS